MATKTELSEDVDRKSYTGPIRVFEPDAIAAIRRKFSETAGLVRHLNNELPAGSFDEGAAIDLEMRAGEALFFGPPPGMTSVRDRQP